MLFSYNENIFVTASKAALQIKANNIAGDFSFYETTRLHFFIVVFLVVFLSTFI